MNISDMTLSSRVQTYFNRIGYELDRSATPYKLLCDLQYAHVTTVPYENLDILRRRPLSLDADALYEKIVLNKRGGYCFELNALYCSLLKELGFEVHSHFARYLRGEQEEIPMRRHRILRVEGEECDYICDVGIANMAPRHPLKLIVGEEQQQFGECYKIEQEPFFGYVVYLKYADKWERFYSFTLEEETEVDFVATSFYLEHSDTSAFNKKEMVGIKTKNGRKTIDGKMFRVYDGKQMDIPIASEEMMHDLLEIHYGIKL